MEHCYVRNFYRMIKTLTSSSPFINQTSEMSTINPISPEFVAASITGFSVVFTLFSLHYIITRVWKIIYITFDFLYNPLNRIKPLGSVGYMNHENHGLSQRQIVNLVRKRRKLGQEVPPVFPNGWFRILDSIFLKKGEVKQVRAFGQNLVAYRGESGKVSVLDAYCSHMGANLAVGGRVKGDCIECPFHAWTFDGKGKCVRVPYAKKLPDFGRIKHWHVKETNGNIFIWYHCENIEPEWEIPSVTEIETGKYKYGGRVEHHINTHIRDIPENGYDEAHLQHLHLPFLLSGVDLSTQFDSRLNIADQIIDTNYKEMGSSGEKHIASFDLVSSWNLFRRWTVGSVSFKIYQIGPGIVHLYLQTSIGKIVVVQNTTAVEPMDQVLTHHIYTEWHIPLVVAKLALLGVEVQVDRDLMVWNNRTFLAQPLLLKEEKIQKTFRRWFQQFYTENSPKLGEVESENLDW